MVKLDFASFYHISYNPNKVKDSQSQKGGKTVRISDVIAGFINDLINQTGGTAEVQRSELAGRFNCVPSQINYVIATRFSPEHGYAVESRRGGGGFIRITRVEMEPRMLIMHTVNTISDKVDINTATALVTNLLRSNAIHENTSRLLLSAIGNNALRPIRSEDRDVVRASILKQMLVNSI